MNFQNPNILYALFALIIPIIVHLFQLRKFEKTAFTNVKFLKELILQTRKSSRIKKWLLLSTRLLVFASIIFAFAQPYFDSKNSIKQEKETVIYLDNSFSMQEKGAKGELFKIATQELLQHFNTNEKISVLTNTKTYKNTTLSAIKNELIATDYSPTQLPYKTVVLKANQLFSKQKNTIKRLLIISDFQQKTALDSSFFNTNIQTALVQVKPIAVKNVKIDTAYFSTNNTAKSTLHVVIAQDYSEEKNIPISLFNKDSLISKASVLLSKLKNTIDFDLPPNENLNLKVAIQDANFKHDNTLFITRNVPEKINVLTIGNTKNNQFLSKIFTEDEFTLIKNTSKTIDYSSFNTQHVLIWNEIENPSAALIQNTQQFAKNGGTVICIPATKINTNTYNLLTPVFKDQNTTTTRLTKINFSHPIFNQVFEKRITNFQFPTFKKQYRLKNYQSAILSFENGNPLLVNKGNYYLFSAALNAQNSNIKQAPLIVPTLYNIAKSSLRSSTLYYTIGKENKIDIAVKLNKDEVLHLEKDNFNFIPLQQIKGNKVRINTHLNPEKAGIYNVISSNQKQHTSIAYNYNRAESNAQYFEVEKLKNNHISVNNNVVSAIENINSMQKVSSVWKWFVIFAIVFLLIELLILKYFK